MTPSASRRLLGGLAVAVVLSAGSAASRTPGAGDGSPVFVNHFTATHNAFTFGQDPIWTADGRVLSNEPDPAGTSQIYLSRLDGA